MNYGSFEKTWRLLELGPKGREILDAFSKECAAQAFEDAAKESLESQVMVLTHKNIDDGMLDDNHPVIVARRVMRENIAKRLAAKPAALRKP